MKVYCPVKEDTNVKVIKEALKPFGGRCAKIVEGKLEYLIDEEKAQAAYNELKEKGLVS